MARLDALPLRVRWATPDEADLPQLATMFSDSAAEAEFWAAVVVNQPSVTIALGGTRLSNGGHGVPLDGVTPWLHDSTWAWHRDGDHIVLSMAGADIGRLREIDLPR